MNIRQNHSETHGPHAAWRRALNDAIAREGTPLDPETAARFGVGLDVVRALSGAALAAN